MFVEGRSIFKSCSPQHFGETYDCFLSQREVKSASRSFDDVMVRCPLAVVQTTASSDSVAGPTVGPARFGQLVHIQLLLYEITHSVQRGGKEERFCGHGLDVASRCRGSGPPAVAKGGGGVGVIDFGVKPFHTAKNASPLNNPLLSRSGVI